MTICKAKQYSDQMVCVDCSLTWDANDPQPPNCGITWVDCPWTSGKCKRPDCKKGCRAFQAYHDADMGNVRRGER